MAADNSLRVSLRLYRAEDTELLDFLDALPKKDRARRIRALLRKAVYFEISLQRLESKTSKSPSPQLEAEPTYASDLAPESASKLPLKYRVR